MTVKVLPKRVGQHAVFGLSIEVQGSPGLFEVPLTPELYKHVAIHADDWWFGHLFVVPNEETGLGTVVARHVLMGDYLDKDELLYAVKGVAGSGDDIDDRLKEQFGGKRYEDT